MWLCNYSSKNWHKSDPESDPESDKSFLHPCIIKTWQEVLAARESDPASDPENEDVSKDQIAEFKDQTVSHTTRDTPHGLRPAEGETPGLGIAQGGSTLSGHIAAPRALALPSLEKSKAAQVVKDIQLFILERGVGQRVAPNLIHRVLKNFTPDEIKATLEYRLEWCRLEGCLLEESHSPAKKRRTIKEFFGTDRCAGNAAVFIDASREAVADIAKLKTALQKAAANEALRKRDATRLATEAAVMVQS
jgi:hypothetical protein